MATKKIDSLDTWFDPESVSIATLKMFLTVYEEAREGRRSLSDVCAAVGCNAKLTPIVSALTFIVLVCAV